GLAGRLAFSAEFYRALGIEPSSQKSTPNNSPKVPLGDPLRGQVAASVQQACATIAAGLAEKYRATTGAKDLCLAGGLFLNPAIVSHMENSTGFERVFVQPAAGNEGTALGAAWYFQHHVQGKPRTSPIEHIYWGPSYSNQEIKNVLDNCKIHY